MSASMRFWRGLGNDMRTLHLCAGHGGGLLADLILGHTIIGAVEWDDFAQRVLRARQADGFLPSFPIHSDMRQFDGRPWRGSVDLVSGGIPCQGFSTAGKQLGAADPRNLWPDAIRILRETRAPWYFLENVANLTSFDYWGVILQDLAAAGYDARWCVLSAGDVGAPHLRKRVWLLATDTACFRRDVTPAPQPGYDFGFRWSSGQAGGLDLAQSVAYATGERRAEDGSAGERSTQRTACGGPVGDADDSRLAQRQSERSDHGEAFHAAIGASGRFAQPDMGGVDDGMANQLDRPDWWSIERGLPRVAGKQPERAERLRGCGNGQVAMCAAAAYRLLGGR